ncbi:beta-lactamase [Actinoplanes sp. SE50]|uniref:serine hydrolase domain-containing protein n=1 Tax=unclassified Actinoplanes TaxID=2626549 RepID=UPI00023ECA0E|nr:MULTISPECIES: serine hydrolase domain-containing protein [unclassified Actinoplanes]AEV87093.1 D-stereospecific peptide hydrolase precursor [Actinoplanes sp. SE50/110]ATO85491.1 beta-lactamase [Actinoplanes sp. SE50]SLM02903.1 serine hydrolase [Actinoplanes sp. SE50/110]
MRSHQGKRRLLLLASVVALTASLLAGTPGAAAPAGHSAQATLDSVLAAQYAKSPLVPGIGARVDAPGLHWTAAVGHDDRAAGTPLRTDVTFRIASVTKTFTAAAVLALADRHRLDLDAPVARYLPRPYPQLLRRGGYRPDLITVRHLLAHTSGLYDYGEDAGYQEAVLSDLHRHWTPAEQIRWAMDHGAPYGRPGERYHYADTGYVLLARIIESVTGMAQATAYRHLLPFSRLGLTATWFETLEPAPGHAADRREHQYYIDPTSGTALDAYSADPSFDLYGGGGLVSSLADLDRFYRGLLEGRVISRSSLATMLAVTPGAEGDRAGMGIFSRTLDGVTCWWHNGFWGAAALYCPRYRLAVSVTTGAFVADPEHATPGAITDAAALADAAIGLLRAKG